MFKTTGIFYFTFFEYCFRTVEISTTCDTYAISSNFPENPTKRSAYVFKLYKLLRSDE